jgi:hypothetical protein
VDGQRQIDFDLSVLVAARMPISVGGYPANIGSPPMKKLT